MMQLVQRIVVCGFLVSCLAQPASADAVDDYIERQMTQQHIPGLALAVIRDGKPVKVRGYGLSNIEQNTPVTADSVFKIGSVSKQFIATGIMLLIRDGKLNLDDPINKFLDAPPDSWQDITVRHVLSHTSGLVRESPTFNALKVQTDAEVIRGAYALPLVFKTGEKFQYCNLGYFILADMIRTLSGEPWPEFIGKRVFRAAGMTATGITDNVTVIPQRAAGYVFNRDKFANAAFLLALRPSGAFISSLNDLVRWDTALRSQKVLNAAELESMGTSVRLLDGANAGYGLGWFVDDGAHRDGAHRDSTHRHVHHAGSLAGFRAEFSRFVNDGVTVIVLTNNETAAADTIAVNVAGKYIDGLVPQRTAVRMSNSQLDEYVGRYVMPGAGNVVITREDNQLVATFAAFGSQWRFNAEDPTNFYVADDPRTQAGFERSGPTAQPTLILRSNGVETGRGIRQEPTAAR